MRTDVHANAEEPGDREWRLTVEQLKLSKRPERRMVMGYRRWIVTGGIVVVAVAGFWLAAKGVQDVGKDDREARRGVAEGLKKLVKGEGKWEGFAVTYSDLHGFHGGLSLTITGAGKVKQEAVRQEVGEAKEVTKEELKKLVALLIEQKAWEQRVPERKAVPDESNARLLIKCGEASCEIWEWYNDMETNKHLIVIREAMKKAAWREGTVN